MGCDIHTFIEYSDFIHSDHDHIAPELRGTPYWRCLGGRFNPGRNYGMFGILAGVRTTDHQLFKQRGLPEGKLSWEVEDYMRIRIADEGEEPTEGEVSLATAQNWTQGRYSETVTELDGKPRWVTNPDLHSSSWLTSAELRQVIARYCFETSYGTYDVGWDAILAAMEAIEARPGCQARLIFCFDN